ncbi:hypothetical protein SLE2022_014630 [Rubroshorea leprosula]
MFNVPILKRIFALSRLGNCGMKATFWLWLITWSPIHPIEVPRCIHVGLLCVQEFAKDRPNMSTVISMLNSEIVDLPRPKQPAFILRQNNASDAESTAQHDQQRCSLNHVTLSMVEGRQEESSSYD